MKEIYWIDDNVTQLINYVEGIFTELWGEKEGIASVIRVFGDGYKESDGEKDWDEKAIKKLKEKIKNHLIQHCKNLEGWNWNSNSEMFKEKKMLIEKPPQLIEVKKDVIASIIAEWKKVNSWDEYKEKKGKNKLAIDGLIDELNIPEGASVAIDLVLLKGDRERVKKKEVPIISMAIYEALRKGNHTCILYSNFTYDYLFIEDWKRIYNREKEPGQQVEKVYSGRSMWEKAERGNIIEELKRIAKEGEDDARRESE